MQALEDAALLCGQRAENLWCVTAHAHKTDRRLRVAVGDALKQDVNRVSLRTEPGWGVVSVATALAVVDNDHDRFENHLGCCLVGVVEMPSGERVSGLRVSRKSLHSLVGRLCRSKSRGWKCAVSVAWS